MAVAHLHHEVALRGLERVDLDLGVQRAGDIPRIHLTHPAWVNRRDKGAEERRWWAELRMHQVPQQPSAHRLGEEEWTRKQGGSVARLN